MIICYFSDARSIHIRRRIEYFNKCCHDVYLLTDIFVMPSLSESCGVIAMEAQSMEVPVVATRVGGVLYDWKQNARQVENLYERIVR